jgi:N utilization substance protein B
MLFQIDLTGETSAEVFAPFWSAQPTADDARAFAEQLVHGVSSHRRGLDRILAGTSEHWRVERMAVVDRNVLRMAVYELVFEADTPPAVVIDEAIEVAKRFGGEESGAFVNGVLDAVRKALGRGEVLAPPAD